MMCALRKMAMASRFRRTHTNPPLCVIMHRHASVIDMPLRKLCLWRTWWLLVLASAISASAQRQEIPPKSSSLSNLPLDPQLARIITSTRAIDNHAHPVLPPPADLSDKDFDALPVDNMEPETDPTAWRADNPQLPAAWAALWGFKGTVPLDAEGIKRLETARARVKAREK